MWKTKRHADEGFAKVNNLIIVFYGQAVRRPGGLCGSDLEVDGQAVGRPFRENFKYCQQDSVRLAPTLAQT